MDDKELLELAAKAHGSLHYEDGLGWIVIESDGGRGKWWNPLDNDGDALRLAVRLGMEVYIDNHPEGCHCVEVESHTHKAGRVVVGLESHDSNESATRRAIVRCAADIGRQMQECNP